MSRAIVFNVKERAFLKFGGCSTAEPKPNGEITNPFIFSLETGVAAWDIATYQARELPHLEAALSITSWDFELPMVLDPLYPETRGKVHGKVEQPKELGVIETNPIGPSFALPSGKEIARALSAETLAADLLAAIKQVGFEVRAAALPSGEKLLTVEEFLGTHEVHEKEYICPDGGAR